MKMVLYGGNLTYYASIMLDAFLCLLCCHNWLKPTHARVCVFIVIMPTIKISCRSDLYTMLQLLGDHTS